MNTLNTIITQIKAHRRYKIVVSLTIIGTILLFIRVASTQTILFTFLLWNLFLAFLPLVFSKSLRYSSRISNSKFLSGLFIILWLLFIPNSPYIVTDLKHVDNDYGMQVYDFVLILGILSLNQICFFIAFSTLYLWKKPGSGPSYLVDLCGFLFFWLNHY